MGHVHDPRETVPHRVGEVVVVDLHETRAGEVGIDGAEWALRGEEPAQGIEPEGVRVPLERFQVDEVSQRLAHLLPLARPPAVGIDGAGQTEPLLAGDLLERHQQRGPDHGVEPEDVLPDQVE